MALKQRIDDDLKAALLGGNRFVVDVLRGLKAAILNEEVAKNARETGLDDSVVEQIIAREVKKRNESAELYKTGGREELAEAELKEAEVLKEYLPEQVDEEAVKAEVDATIAKLGASGPQAMGQVIGVVKAKFGNTADGATIAKIVKESLN